MRKIPMEELMQMIESAESPDATAERLDYLKRSEVRKSEGYKRLATVLALMAANDEPLETFIKVAFDTGRIWQMMVDDQAKTEVPDEFRE